MPFFNLLICKQHRHGMLYDLCLDQAFIGSLFLNPLISRAISLHSASHTVLISQVKWCRKSGDAMKKVWFYEKCVALSYANDFIVNTFFIVPHFSADISTVIEGPGLAEG